MSKQKEGIVITAIIALAVVAAVWLYAVITLMVEHWPEVEVINR